MEAKTGIPDHALRKLRDWKPKEGKGQLPPDSVQNVLRALVRQQWPGLETVFDDQARSYRQKEEKQGLWEVPSPLLPLIKQYAVPAEPIPAAPPTVSETPPQEPVQAPVVVAEAPAQSPVPDGLQTVLSMFADVFEYGAKRFRGEQPAPATHLATPAPPPAPVEVEPIPLKDDPVGSRLNGIDYCLDRVSFTPRPGLQLKNHEIERIKSSIKRLRELIVLLCSLDPKYIQKKLRPELGPELVELFLANEGLRHLLATPEAWDLIRASRVAAGIVQNAQERNS